MQKHQSSYYSPHLIVSYASCHVPVHQHYAHIAQCILLRQAGANDDETSIVRTIRLVQW